MPEHTWTDAATTPDTISTLFTLCEGGAKVLPRSKRKLPLAYMVRMAPAS